MGFHQPNNPLVQYETSDPTNVADIGQWYTKDVAGITEAFYMDSAGNPVQVTSGGAVAGGGGAPGGLNGQVQYNNAGAFGGDSGYTYDAATDVASLAGGMRFVERAAKPHVSAAGEGVIYVKNTVPSTLIYVDDAGSEFTLGAGGTPGGATTQVQYNLAGAFAASSNFSITPAAQAVPGVEVNSFHWTQPQHTSLPSATENKDFYIDLSPAIEWINGSFATQRSMYINAPTYDFTGASTIDTAATTYISGAPNAGVNCTITTKYALWIGSGQQRIGGGLIMDEVAAIPGGAPPAGQGTIWVENTTPNRLRYTDDAGTTYTVAGSGVFPLIAPLVGAGPAQYAHGATTIGTWSSGGSLVITFAGAYLDINTDRCQFTMDGQFPAGGAASPSVRIAGSQNGFYGVNASYIDCSIFAVPITRAQKDGNVRRFAINGGNNTDLASEFVLYDQADNPYTLWVDATGDLRIEQALGKTNDTSGTIVGTQT